MQSKRATGFIPTETACWWNRRARPADLGTRTAWDNTVVMNRVLFLWLVGLSLAAAAQQGAPTKPGNAARNAQDLREIYRDAKLGFRYHVPYGWVDRTETMRQGASGDQGGVLLAVFERPPEANGDTVNSAVVIATENATSYPGLKKAEDYLGPLTELVTAKGMKADGDPTVIRIDARELVRADFTKALNDKLTMHQATLILLEKGQIVSFTFIADSDDAVEELMDELHFGAKVESGPKK